MTTIDQVKKHYNKLTAPERFALMIAAAVRDDTGEERALADSAPKVNFEFPHTVGLTYGFRQLVKHHVIQQLGAAGTFFMVMYLQQDEAGAERIAKAEGLEIPDGETVLSLVARRFLEGLEAFRAICQEYKVDPAALEEVYDPYPMLSCVMEVIALRAFDMSKAELTDLEKTKAAYRAMIEGSREHWAEAKARA